MARARNTKELVAGSAGSFGGQVAANVVAHDGIIVGGVVSRISSNGLLAIRGLRGGAAARLGWESGSSVNVTRKGGVVLFEG